MLASLSGMFIFLHGFMVLVTEPPPPNTHTHILCGYLFHIVQNRPFQGDMVESTLFLLPSMKPNPK